MAAVIPGADALGRHIVDCPSCHFDSDNVLDDALCLIGERLAKQVVLAIADRQADREWRERLVPGEYDSDDLDRADTEYRRNLGDPRA